MTRSKLVLIWTVFYLLLTGASPIDEESREVIRDIQKELQRQTEILEAQVGSSASSSSDPAILQKLSELTVRFEELQGKIFSLTPSPQEGPDWSPQFSLLSRQLRTLSWLVGGTLLATCLLFFMNLKTRSAMPKKKRMEPVKGASGRRETGRPQLEVAPDQNKIRVVNVGRGSAEEIRLLVGPAPSTLTERQRVVGILQSGEEAVLELSQWGTERLYGSLQYKNPATGRSYKNLFALGYNAEQGRFFAEAS